MKATAIFDIGKTNKKFFLFDSAYRQIHKAYTTFEEVEDEDGFPCDNLPAIQQWIKESFQYILKEERFQVKSLNFSTYGASLVHLDKEGKPLTPLYNYLKPIPEEILADFYRKYGDELSLTKETASPALGMLNSGLQLYWLKYTRPEIFAKIHHTLHLPQYFSFLFTGIPLSEYTSIGCHTALWDYQKKEYHRWVYAEGFDKILPPTVHTNTSIQLQYEGRKLSVGVGIHDSSAALLPYLRSSTQPFLLISTGTWNISINPFNQEVLTKDDLQADCLNFMNIEGKAVKASRLFLGNEYKLQIDKLNLHFEKEADYHKHIKFDLDMYAKLNRSYFHHFRFESIALSREQPSESLLDAFSTFEEAYHQLLMELLELQIQSCERAIGNTAISKFYIDGGFAENDIYLKLLSRHFQDVKIQTAQSPIGSALGAALLVSNKKVGRNFLKKNYQLKKYTSPIFTNQA